MQIIKAKFQPVVVPSVETAIHVPVVGTFDIFIEDTHLQSLLLSEEATGMGRLVTACFPKAINSDSETSAGQSLLLPLLRTRAC